MTNQLQRFLLSDPQENSLAFALKTFLQKQKRRGRSSHTIKHVFRSIHALDCHLNSPDIHQLSRDEIQAYTQHLRQHYAVGTIIPVIGDMRQFFKWCRKKGYTRKNLAKNLRKPRPGKSQIKAAPEKDVAIVLNGIASQLNKLLYRDVFHILQINEKAKWGYLNLKRVHDLFAITFLYETGCRAGELTGITVSDMNEATTIKKQSYHVVAFGKTGKVTLRFTNATAELWRVWYQVRSDKCDYAVVSWKRGQEPQRFKTNGLSLMLVRRCKSAGIRPFRCHSLRHAKIRRSRKLIGVELTSELIGHRKISTTLNYANIDDDELSKAVIITGLNHDIWG